MAVWGPSCEASREKRDSLGTGVGFCVAVASVTLLLRGGFFFCGFLATERGLNIIALPCFLGSSFDVVAGGSVIPNVVVSYPFSVRFDSGLFVIPPLPASPLPSKGASALSIGSRLKPGVAPVFKFTPLPKPPFLRAGPPFAADDRFGAGRKELKPPRPPAPILALLAGGSGNSDASLWGGLVGSGRLIRILWGLEGSTTFLKAGFVVVVLMFWGCGELCSISESSESR